MKITGYHVIFGEIPDPIITVCMESAINWCKLNNVEYKRFDEKHENLEPGEDPRFAADLRRLEIAAKLAPCIYFDWDMKIFSSFKIPDLRRASIGVPPIAFFYLPTPDIALETIEKCEDYRKEHGVLHPNVVSNFFEESFLMGRKTTEHLSWHKIMRTRKEATQ